MIWRRNIKLEKMEAGGGKSDAPAGTRDGKNFEQIPLQSGYRRNKKEKIDNDRSCYVTTQPLT